VRFRDNPIVAQGVDIVIEIDINNSPGEWDCTFNRGIVCNHFCREKRMQNFTVCFAHGRESGPWGIKIRALAKVAETLGCRVVSRDDSDTLDPDLRVTRLIEEARAIDGPVVLVGSSMGGYVVTAASQVIQPVGLFLMAPAMGMPGYKESMPVPHARKLSVVHGWDDDIVPLEMVLEFARTHRAMLHVVPAGHALVEQLDWLTMAFADFLQNCMDFDSATARERLLATF